MKSEQDIRKWIEDMVAKLKDINENAHRDNPLIYADEKKEQLCIFSDIRCLHDVLEEPIPPAIFTLF